MATAPHDGLPAEHCLALEEGAEDRDALRLYGEEVGETELVGERVVTLERLVDGVPTNDARLVGVEPLLHVLLEVVLGRSRALQLGVHHLVGPARVAGFHRAVHADGEIQRGLGGGRVFGRAETVVQDLLETRGVSNPTLHHVLRELGERIHHSGTELLRLTVKHWRFFLSLWVSPVFVLLADHHAGLGHCDHGSNKAPLSWGFVYFKIGYFITFAWKANRTYPLLGSRTTCSGSPTAHFGVRVTACGE